jgi:hypothetical protein
MHPAIRICLGCYKPSPVESLRCAECGAANAELQPRRQAPLGYALARELEQLEQGNLWQVNLSGTMADARLDNILQLHIDLSSTSENGHTLMVIDDLMKGRTVYRAHADLTMPAAMITLATIAHQYCIAEYALAPISKMLPSPPERGNGGEVQEGPGVRSPFIPHPIKPHTLVPVPPAPVATITSEGEDMTVQQIMEYMGTTYGTIMVMARRWGLVKIRPGHYTRASVEQAKSQRKKRIKRSHDFGSIPLHETRAFPIPEGLNAEVWQIRLSGTLNTWRRRKHPDREYTTARNGDSVIVTRTK